MIDEVEEGWCIQPKHNAALVAVMADVLKVHQRPAHPRHLP